MNSDEAQNSKPIPSTTNPIAIRDLCVDIRRIRQNVSAPTILQSPCILAAEDYKHESESATSAQLISPGNSSNGEQRSQRSRKASRGHVYDEGCVQGNDWVNDVDALTRVVEQKSIAKTKSQSLAARTHCNVSTSPPVQPTSKLPMNSNQCSPPAACQARNVDQSARFMRCRKDLRPVGGAHGNCDGGKAAMRDERTVSVASSLELVGLSRLKQNPFVVDKKL